MRVNEAGSPGSSVVHPAVRIGHVHLKVSSISRALTFWRDLLGFEVTAHYGPGAVFLSAGGYHHHIGLNAWESSGGAPPAPNATGLYHVAVLYPDRRELARTVRRIAASGHPITGAADHGVSEAVYLADPDGNGVELYRDRPEAEWPRTPDGGLVMYTRGLDLGSLLSEDGAV